VNLPDDLAPGDTVSVTVNPLTAGPDEKAREKQGKELAAHTVELAGERAVARKGIRTFDIPADARFVTIRLLDARGRTAGEVDVPLVPSGTAASPTGYEIPSLGQSGAPVQVSGPFDGDLSNSSVRIDGTDADPVGETPRQLVVRGPQEGTAHAPVEVRDRGAVVATGSYRNVNVRLSAGATTLRSGQKTTLTVTVTGVEGLRETLPVQLTNRSPAVVQMEGGDEQTLCIRPDDVKVDGSWEAERGLTGVTLGGFQIGTVVSQPRLSANPWTAIPGEMRNELRARLFLERPARSTGGRSIAAGPWGVLVEGAGDGGRVRLVLVRGGEERAALDGRVFQRLPSRTPCDREEASETGQRLHAGTGRPDFSDLGFENDALFEVRDGEGGRRLALETEDEDFSIEAALAAESGS